MSIVADIGDASQLMGEEWTEDQLQKMSLLVAQGLTSKSYLAGMQQFVDLFAGKPGQFDRIIAGLANNQVPLAGLRNELGKLFTPYTRELGSGIDQAIRNRNLITENITGEQLPIKYDLLNGKPIKDHDPLTRMFNAVSPLSFNLDNSPARTFLFRSGYDLRTSTYYSPGPNSVNLTDSPKIRSLYQKAIGDQNLEAQILKLSKQKRAQASLLEMEKDIRDGNRGAFESKDYYHNRELNRIITEARKNAWWSLRDNRLVMDLALDQTGKKQKRKEKTAQTSNVAPLLRIYK